MSDELKTGMLDKNGNVVTPMGRLMFANLLEPQQPGPKNKLKAAKYSCVIAFPADADMTLLKNLRAKTATEFFGDKLKNADFAKLLRNPVKDQDTLRNATDGTLYDGAVPGEKYVSIAANPGYFDRDSVVGADGKTRIAEPRELYSGCWVRATVNAYGYDQSGNKGISFGMLGVQKVKDGSPLGGGGPARPEDSFTAVVTAQEVGKAADAGAGAGSVFDD